MSVRHFENTGIGAKGFKKYSLSFCIAMSFLLGMAPFKAALAASSLSLTQSAQPTSYSSSGQTINYSYIVTNTGTDAITTLAVTDTNNSTINCPLTSLSPTPPNNTTTCTATYTITQADIDDGSLTNTATATGLNSESAVVTSNASPSTINATQNPSLSLGKSSTVTNYSAGQTIPYSYLVTNSGNVTMSSIAVTDAHVGLSAITCPQTSLVPGASTTCTATYVATQANVDSGSIHNTARASGNTPSGTQINSPVASLTINSVPASPSLSLVKSSNLTTYTEIGQVIPYSYLVTNTGNVTISTIVVTDNKIPSPITCPATTLAPSDSTTCTGNYTVTLADMDAGSITNTAGSTGKSPTNVTVTSNNSNLQINATLNPALTITKSSTTTSFSAPGTPITYRYVVTNSGNDTINTIAVTDNKITAPISCSVTTLAPGASTTCTGNYTTTQADVDTNGVTNIGSVTGKNIQGTAAVASPTAPYLVPADQNPSISMSKSTTTSSYDIAGETIDYSYSVTNTGNQTLNTVAINDPMITGPITCNATVLAPNASTSCSATYTVTQTDVDAGFITNNATAGGQNQEGTMSVVSPTSSVTIFAVNSPSLSLTKSSSTVSFDHVDQTLSYSYTITNNGNTTLTSIAIADNKIPSVNISCADSSLAPGASTDCTATYSSTQADIDRGGVTNTAQAAGLNPSGRTFKSNSATVTVPAIQNPVINMVKSTSTSNFSNPNEYIAYTYQITNNGNTTLFGIGINDNKINSNIIDCGATTLAPGASTTCTANYETTQADVDAGGVENNATAQGASGIGTTVQSTPTQTVTVPSVQLPALGLVKATSTPSFTLAGQIISYSYLAKNTGNVTISFLTVNDDKTTVTCGAMTLAPHTSTNCTATYMTTQDDVNFGGITNLANAVGISPQGLVVTSPNTADSTLTVKVTPMQGVTLSKTSNPSSYSEINTPITYSYLITNTGNLTLGTTNNPISLNDNRLGVVSCPSNTLNPGLSMTCTATHITTQADLDAGSISNTATVTALTSIGTARASASLTVQGPASPGITISKATNTGGYAIGSSITYFYTVVNTGNVTLNPITITDSHVGLSAISCPTTSLGAGAQTICTATYLATAADVAAGSISDTASVVGNSPQGNATATSNTLVITAGTGYASITVAKSANVSSYSTTGVLITYSYLVSNPGAVGYTFTLTDNLLNNISCPTNTLAAGASTTCTATHSTTQADLNNGSITNTATASGPGFQSFSSLTINAIQSPSMTLVKSTASSSYDSANQTITYSYLLTNTGNISLSGLTLSDNLINASNLFCPSTSMAPGGTIICQGIYTTTQADVDNGSISNTATATMQQLPSPVTTTKVLNAALNPQVSLTKSTSTTSYNAPNQTLTYSYLVKNLGNDTLSNIVVTDNKIPGPITCVTTTIAPGESTVCSGTYKTTLADLDAGVVFNTGTVVAQNQQGTSVNSSSTATVYAQLSPSLSITKTANSPPFSTPGVTLSYTYTVTNTGNDTISGIGISDNKIPAQITCQATSLAPEASTTCTGTYTTTLADIDAGGVTNSATSFGVNPQGSSVRSSPASATVPAILNPSISLVKSSTTANYNSPNKEIHYSYLVTNTGNDTLNTIRISDNKFASSNQISCAATSLAPAASTTCTSTYVSTQADVDNGSIVNTATVSAQNPQGTVVISSPSSVTVPAILTPSISMKKSTTATSFNAAGVSIPYTYHVVNTGNDTLINLTITDNKLLSGITCPVTTLGRGMATNCTGTYITTQADVDGNVLTNTAFASAQNNQGTVVRSANSSVTLIPVQRPAISLVKTSTTASYNATGQTVSYNYVVTNTGNDTLNSITIADNKVTVANINCPVTSLAPNTSTTCTGTHTVTLADMDNGSLTNTATTTGRNAQGTSVTSPVSSATVNAVLTPAITLVKSSTSTTFTAAGQSIPYRYLVTNTGNSTLRSITVADSKIATANISCPVTTLAPNASTTCTATYTATLADIDRGFVTNTATTTGRNNQGTSVTSSPSQVTVNAVQLPAITMVKSTTTGNYTAAGQTITYRYRVTNTGNDTLTPIIITDNKVATANISCQASSLAPAAATTCTGAYVVTQADVDAGSVTNVATATGTNTMSTSVTSSQSSVTVNSIPSPSLSVVKTGTPSTFAAPNVTLTYTYTVTNNGNETITNIAISDNVILSNITCASTSLAPGISTNCTGTYSTTQADVDAGEVSNTAHASARNPQGTTITSPSVFWTIPATINSSVTMTKTTTATTYDTAGELIPYSYQVTNMGNDTLHNIAISDSKLASGITCLATVLAPGASTTCSGNYTVTQADIDGDVLTNTATATARNSQDAPVNSSPSSVTLNPVQNPEITLVKTTTSANFNAVGQVIPYYFQVTNTGNDTLSSIVVTDSLLNTISCPQATLAPGVTMICTGNYTVVQADIENGSITNTATVAAVNPVSTPVSAGPSSVLIDAIQMPAITLSKTATTSTYVNAGDTINYEYLVTNSGNNILSEIVIADSKIASMAISCSTTTLNPGAFIICSGTYTVTQQDVDAGSVTNMATVSAHDAAGTVVASLESTAVVNATAADSITLVKSSTTANYHLAGDSINYQYLVTNTGNNTLSNITISDDKLLSGIVCPLTVLAPGASTTCTGTYITNQQDVDAGTVVNSATVSGQGIFGTTVSPASTATVNAVLTPGLALTKVGGTPSYSQPGDILSYTFRVTNTGNNTLMNIAIADSRITGQITCTLTTLAPAQFTTCSGTYAVTLADINAGSVVNTATASGEDQQQNITTSPQASATINANINSSMSLSKSANSANYDAPGQVIIYEYIITNTGNDTLLSLSVADSKISSVNCPSTPINPGDSLTCTGSYTTTQADVDAGSVLNTALASGLNSQNANIQSSSQTFVVPAIIRDALTLAKSTTVTSFNAAGESIPYQYLVNNVGNVTLFGLTINDDKIPSGITCQIQNLAPGASTTCNGTYVTTQADVDAGILTNVATVGARTSLGIQALSITSTTSITANLAPGVSLVKSSQAQGYSFVGQEIPYTYLVRNTGNETLTNPVITDDKITSSITCLSNSIAPNQSTTCSGIYTVTQADIDNATITNVATVAASTLLGVVVNSAASDLTLSFIPPTGTLTVVKTADIKKFTMPGTPISYNYLITNNGVTELHDIALNDSMLGIISCPVTILAPGASTNCKASYVTTIADAQQGSITNVATATGLTPTGILVSGTDAITITLDAEYIRQKTLGAIKNFLDDRVQLILSSEPDRRRIINRLAQRNSECSNAPRGNIVPGIDGGSTRFDGSMSLSNFCVQPSKFDIWTEVHGSYFRQNMWDSVSNGEFGVAYLGVDYLVNSSIIAGVLGEGDIINRNGQGLYVMNASGQGLMAGPYLSARLLPELYLHTRAAWGTSSNKINTFGYYDDSFRTQRSLYNAELVGDSVWNKVRVSPTLGLSYYNEYQLAFTNFLNVAIPGQNVNLAQANFGPEVAYLMLLENSREVTLRLSLQGLYNFAYDKDIDPLLNAPSPITDFSGRAKLSADFRFASGFSITPMVLYDGIGNGVYNSIQAQLQLNFPMD